MYKNPIDPATWPQKGFLIRALSRVGLGIGLTLLIFAASFFVQPADQRERIVAYWRSLKINPGFRPEHLLATPLSVQIHVIGVAAALFVGALVLALSKGTSLHRALGWIWVLAMSTVAVTSLFMIRDFGDGVSPLHAFTAITAISLFFGLFHIKRGNVRGHAGFMIGLFFGGLIVAGLFAFIPGRTMWRVFFGG